MKKLQILLTNPCIENWLEMTPSKLGRYCDSCTKQVVDLATKSDAEIVEFFSKKRSNVCGRISSSQLNRELTIPQQKNNSLRWLLGFALTASAVIPTTSLKAQKSISVTDNQTTSSNPKILVAKSSHTAATDIKGKVTDMNGNPLANVKISRKGFRNVIAHTDSLGLFKIKLAVEERIHPLVFELGGYDIMEQVISTNMLVKLREAPTIMLGGLHIVDTSTLPLYVVAVGKQTCTLKNDDFPKINPNWIENLEVLKDAKATATYGSKAKNGVIVVTLKEEYADKINFSKGKIKK